MIIHRVAITTFLDTAVGHCVCGFSSGDIEGERRAAKARQALLVHLEAAAYTEHEYHIKDGSALVCPICKSKLDLAKEDKGLLLHDQPSVIQCEDGHAFDAYYKNKTLFLFQNFATDGPFSTY